MKYRLSDNARSKSQWIQSKKETRNDGRWNAAFRDIH